MLRTPCNVNMPADESYRDLDMETCRCIKCYAVLRTVRHVMEKLESIGVLHRDG